MKIGNGELSQFAKTAEGISYAFYDIRKNSDALDDLSRVVAKLDSDTLETAEQQAAVATEQARRICNLEDSNLDIIADLRGFDTLAMEFSDMKGIVANLFNLVNGLVERMGEVERHAIESDQFARQVHTTASGNSVAVDTLARKLEESVDPLWEPVDEVDVGCTCGPCAVHSDLQDRFVEMGAEYGSVNDLNHTLASGWNSRETLVDHPAWYAYAGKMGDPCWNDPSKRCYPPNNTCATCVPVEDTVEDTVKTYEERLWPYAPITPTPGEEWWYDLCLVRWEYNPNWDDHVPVTYTLGTSGEKLTGPFDPTPGEEWWYSLPLLMWQYNPAWDAAPTRNTNSPLHVLLAETPPCDACPCAVCDAHRASQPSVLSRLCEGPICPKHMYSAGFGHTHNCTPDTDCTVCYPPEKEVILCGGMSLTARSDCPCSRCVKAQGFISRFRKTWLA